MRELEFNGIKINVYSTKELEDADCQFSEFSEVGEGAWWHGSITWGDVMQALGYESGKWDPAVPEDWFQEKLTESRHEATRRILSSPAKLEKAGYTDTFIKAKMQYWEEKGVPDISLYNLVFENTRGMAPEAFWVYDDQHPHGGPIWKSELLRKLEKNILAALLTISLS